MDTDRAEALAEWRELEGIPDVDSDEHWDGVLTPSTSRQGGTA